MYEITKGYKQGRAVTYYDLFDQLNNKNLEMVSKEDVVKMCQQGEIVNASVQIWQEKPIVRVKNSNLPLVKIDLSGEVIGVSHKAVRSTSASESSDSDIRKTIDTTEVKLPKANIVGKLNPKKVAKTSTAFTGYDLRHVAEQQQLFKEIKYDKMDTLEDLFNTIANDFGAKQVDVYKAEVSKKVKLTRKVKDINRLEVYAIQNAFVDYIMNMVYDEIHKAFLKYKVVGCA